MAPACGCESGNREGLAGLVKMPAAMPRQATGAVARLRFGRHNTMPDFLTQLTTYEIIDIR